MGGCYSSAGVRKQSEPADCEAPANRPQRGQASKQGPQPLGVRIDCQAADAGHGGALHLEPPPGASPCRRTCGSRGVSAQRAHQEGLPHCQERVEGWRALGPCCIAEQLHWDESGPGRAPGCPSARHSLSVTSGCSVVQNGASSASLNRLSLEGTRPARLTRAVSVLARLSTCSARLQTVRSVKACVEPCGQRSEYLVSCAAHACRTCTCWPAFLTGGLHTYLHACLWSWSGNKV